MMNLKEKQASAFLADEQHFPHVEWSPLAFALRMTSTEHLAAI